MCTFVSFVKLACTSTSSSASGDSCLLSMEKGKMMSLFSRLRGHTERYREFELLRSYDVKLGFLVYSSFPEVDCSLFESPWYPFDFDVGLVSCIEPAVEPFIDLYMMPTCWRMESFWRYL